MRKRSAIFVSRDGDVVQSIAYWKCKGITKKGQNTGGKNREEKEKGYTYLVYVSSQLPITLLARDISQALGCEPRVLIISHQTICRHTTTANSATPRHTTRSFRNA